MTKPYRPKYSDGRLCAIEGCPARAEARDFCKLHYSRWRRHGDPLYIRPLREPLKVPDGLTLAEYARVIGISRSRVDQLVNPSKHSSRQITNGAVEDGRLNKPPICCRCFVVTGWEFVFGLLLFLALIALFLGASWIAPAGQ